MAGLNVTAHNAMLDANSAVWPPDAMSLHSTDPGNGTNPAAGEISGGSPAYARKALVWAAAANRAKSATPPTFDVPGGGTVIAFAGFWRGSTYLGCRNLRDTDDTANVSETFTSQGTYTPSTAVTERIA